MKLKSLSLNLEQWGENEGKYEGCIRFEDDKKTEIKIVLEPELASKYVEFSIPILMAAADNATEKFKTKLVEATMQLKQLGNDHGRDTTNNNTSNP